MTMRLTKLAPALGGAITGVDLSNPLDAETVRAITLALAEYGVLVFPDQDLSDAAHVRFARHFGELGTFRQHDGRRGILPEIFRATNTDPLGNLLAVGHERAKLIRLNWSWHTDSSYCAIPTKGAVLHAIEVSENGGDTVFANMAAAYEHLPEAMKEQIAELAARHSFEFLVTSRGLPPLRPEELARLPAVMHPLVRQHTDGRRSLYLSPPYMEAIIPRDSAESRALIAQLTDWATQDRFIYRHKWQAHDVLMWDNGWTMHRVTPYDLFRRRRVMHGATILGTEPIQPSGKPV